MQMKMSLAPVHRTLSLSNQLWRGGGGGSHAPAQLVGTQAAKTQVEMCRKV